MASGIDRLSLLPESLTTAIFSLLPTKDAIRTSVLSHHFHHLWKSLPNIVINRTHFDSTVDCFHFAAQRILNYPPESTIDSFSLTLSPPLPYHLPLIHYLIDFALSDKTKSLELDFAGPAREVPANNFELPTVVYDYDGLEALTLISCGFNASAFVNFGGLKTATFGCMELPNDELNEFLRGCPLLEDLTLFRCLESDVYEVVSTSLTSLVMDSCLELKNLSVITPNLKRLRYVGPAVFLLDEELGALEEGELDLDPTDFYDADAGALVHCLLMGFYNARVLRVFTFVLQILSAIPSLLELESSIGARHLILESALHIFEYIGIAYLLGSCHLLRKIQIDIPPLPNYEDDNAHPLARKVLVLDPTTFWGGHFQAPNCVIQTLQEVEMNGFRGSADHLRFLKFLFKFGMVLETVRLRLAREDHQTRLELQENLPRILGSWPRNSVSQLEILIE